MIEQDTIAGLHLAEIIAGLIIPDTRPIRFAIAQEIVPVLPGDTPESLAARVLEAEHRIYPLALKRVVEGQA